MSTSADLDIAWCAGLFEGEGCFVFGRRPLRKDGTRRCELFLRISMTDEDVIRRFSDKVGAHNTVGRYHYQGRPTHKPVWYCQIVCKADVRRVIKQWWPYLGERRRARASELLTIVDAQIDGRSREAKRLSVERLKAAA